MFENKIRLEKTYSKPKNLSHMQKGSEKCQKSHVLFELSINNFDL